MGLSDNKRKERTRARRGGMWKTNNAQEKRRNEAAALAGKTRRKRQEAGERRASARRPTDAKSERAWRDGRRVCARAKNGVVRQQCAGDATSVNSSQQSVSQACSAFLCCAVRRNRFHSANRKCARSQRLDLTKPKSRIHEGRLEQNAR